MNVHMKNIQTKYKLNFKTMKKGLLTLLAASIVFVGCQNYDDQFDDLNAQISALKSQVDGLSSLSGQVASLSGSISGLQAGVSAAQAAASAASSAASDASAAVAAIPATDLSGLEASLATLAAEVDAVQASLATAATSADIATLQAELDAIEADVDELLATSNVYIPANGTLSVTSSSQLDAAVALGNNLNIINGNVTFTVSTSMDATKIQSVVDKIFTVTGTFTYTASSTEVTAVTFDKLASTGDLTVKQAGDYSFDSLVTAGTVLLDDAYASKVTSIDMPKLTTVTALNTNVSGTSTANSILFSSATNVDLSSLTYYTPATLTITTKKDAALDISKLDDQTATGVADDYTLIVNGPKNINISTWTSYEGKVTATNIENLTLTNFKGEISVGAGVENVTVVGGEQFALSSATKLQTVDVEVVAASDPDLSATIKAASAYGGSIAAYVGETPALSFTGMSDLTSVKLKGLFRDLSFASLGNLTSIDIEAEFEDLSITDNDDLTTIDVSGSKFGDLTLTGNDALVTANFAHTLSLNMTGSTTDDTDVAVDVSTNTELTSFTWGASTISNLNLKTNAKLATIDFSAVTAMGADTTPTVDVYGNNLVASKAEDTDDGTTDYTIDGTNDASDLGTYTTTSGMNTLKVWLGKVQAKANAGAAVHFDKVTLHTIATGANVTSASESAGEQNSGNAKLYTTEKANDVTLVYANTASTLVTTSTATSAQAEKRAFVIDMDDLTAGTTTMSLKIGGTQVLYQGSSYGDFTTSSSNLDVLVQDLKSSQAVSRAAALGATLNVYKGANSTMPNIVFQNTFTSASGGNYENYTDAQVAALYGGNGTVTSFVTSYDKFTLTIGGRSVTTTLTNASGVTSYSGSAAAYAVASQVAAAWEAKYGTAGTTSGDLSFWTGADGDTTSGTIKNIVLKDQGSGSRAYGQTIAFSWTPGNSVVTNATSIATAGVATNTYLDWLIGATDSTADNTAQAVDLILTLEETTEDAITGSAATFTYGASVAPFDELSTTKNLGSGTRTEVLSSNIFVTDAGIFGSIYSGGAGDVRNDELANEGTTSSTGSARATYSRIHWLAS